MSRNLINLLPESRIRAFRRAYFYRLATVALALLAGVIVIHTVLLIPSFLHLEVEQSAREDELARLTRELETTSGDMANKELAALGELATHLSRLSTAPSASDMTRTVLLAPRTGISIVGITYTPPTGSAANGKMTLKGFSTTRESLRAYERALRTVPGVTGVELPISAYAKEADIDFMVTLTGPFTP